VDGYIRQVGAMDSHLSVSGSVLARVAPGSHLVVVRDRDPRRPNRRESNRLTVEVGPRQRITLCASFRDEALHLNCVGTSEFVDSHHD
jgi:hypothetical protein